MEDRLIEMYVKLVVDEPRMIAARAVVLEDDPSASDFTRNYYYYENQPRELKGSK